VLIKGEIKPLTGLRAIAATWVVIFHLVGGRKAVWNQQVPNLDSIGGPLIYAGQLGVDLFFVLSGFVLSLNYLDKLGPHLTLAGSRKFLWARLSRVWPVFFVMINVAGLVELAIARGSDRPLASEFHATAYLQQVTLTQQWFAARHDGTSWDGPAWTVSCEALAYLLFPILALIIARITVGGSPRLLLGLSLIVMAPYVLMMASSESFSSGFSWILRIMCQFLAGMLAYCFVKAVDWTKQRRDIAGVASVLLVVVIVAWLYVADQTAFKSDWSFVVLLFVPLVICLSVGSGPITAFLSTKTLLLGGYISYSLYLVQSPVLHSGDALVSGLKQTHPNIYLTLCVALLPVAFFTAYCMWRFIEEPARLRMRAMVMSREEAEAHPGAVEAHVHLPEKSPDRTPVGL
jgi:peptidoglycan/LPS O-acetylase OafA/YrhL